MRARTTPTDCVNLGSSTQHEACSGLTETRVSDLASDVWVILAKQRSAKESVQSIRLFVHQGLPNSEREQGPRSTRSAHEELQLGWWVFPYATLLH